MLRGLAVLIALVLSLAACGSGNDNADEGGAPNAPTAGKSLLASKQITQSFERGTGGWTELDNGTTVSRTETEAQAGKASLAVKTKGESEFEGVRTDSAPVESDQTYTVHASVRAPKGSVMQVSIRERDAEDSELDGTVTKFTGAGEWDRIEVEREFGANGENARVIVRTGDKPQALMFYVDRVGVKQTPSE